MKIKKKNNSSKSPYSPSITYKKLISGLINDDKYSKTSGKHEEPSFERSNVKSWELRGNSKTNLNGNLKKSFKGNLRRNLLKYRVVSIGKLITLFED